MASEAEQPDWVRTQKRTFTLWVNYHLERNGFAPLEDLTKDLCDGIVLCRLVTSLTSKEFHKLVLRPTMTIQQVENLRKALDVLVEVGVPLVNCGPVEINQGNETIILGLIWRLILHFQVGGRITAKSSDATTTLVESDEEDDELLAEQLEEERRLKEKLSAKARMLAWIRERCYLYDVEVTDFRETFRNGKAFAALVASCSEGFEFKEQVSKPPAELLNDTFEYADSKLGIPQLVRVSDLESNVDEKSLMTYCGMFYDQYSHTRPIRPRRNLHFQLSGLGLQEAVAGRSADFFVLLTEDGDPISSEGRIKCVLKCEDVELSSSLTEMDDQKVQVSYVAPMHEGDLQLELYYDHKCILNTAIEVVPPPPNYTFDIQVSNTVATELLPVKFLIGVCNNGEPCIFPGDIDVECLQDGENLPYTQQEIEGGLHEITLIPTSSTPVVILIRDDDETETRAELSVLPAPIVSLDVLPTRATVGERVHFSFKIESSSASKVSLEDLRVNYSLGKSDQPVEFVLAEDGVTVDCSFVPETSGHGKLRVEYHGVYRDASLVVESPKHSYHVSKSQKRAEVGKSIQLELSIVDSSQNSILVEKAEEYRAVLQSPDGTKTPVEWTLNAAGKLECTISPEQVGTHSLRILQNDQKVYTRKIRVLEAKKQKGKEEATCVESNESDLSGSKLRPPAGKTTDRHGSFSRGETAVVRIHLLNDSVSVKLKLENTFKTLKIDPDSSCADLHDELIKQFVKYMDDVERGWVIRACAKYQLALYQSEERVRALDPTEKPWSLRAAVSSTGTQRLVFEPAPLEHSLGDAAILRAYMLDDYVAQQLSIEHTFKTLKVYPDTTSKELCADLIKQLCKGQEEKLKELISAACADYCLCCFDVDHKKRVRVVKMSEKLWEIREQFAGASATLSLVFQPMPRDYLNFIINYPRSRLTQGQSLIIKVSAKDPKRGNEPVSDLDARGDLLEAVITKPDGSPVYLPAEATTRPGHYEIRWQPEQAGQYSSMIRFNGNNVQSRACVLKVRGRRDSGMHLNVEGVARKRKNRGSMIRYLAKKTDE